MSVWSASLRPGVPCARTDNAAGSALRRECAPTGMRSVTAGGVLLEPDNVFVVRGDVVVSVPVQGPGRIDRSWVEPAVTLDVAVPERNIRARAVVIEIGRAS